MADLRLDFSGVPEYQPNNLQICSMGHITDRAIHPLWKGEPMQGTVNQYAPLGYIARNGLGEELMYAAYIGTTPIPSIGAPISIRIPGAELAGTAFTFTRPTDVTGGSYSAADMKKINGWAFYTFAAATTANPRRYGWVRLRIGFAS